MSGIKFLYIDGQGEIYTIPVPKKFVNKPIPKLANKSVLEVFLFYETRDRKPWRLHEIGFDRILLDELGQYTLTEEEIHNRSYNFINFGFSTPEELGKREEPLSIPKAVALPTVKEKTALIDYIKQKYPMLWKNSPEVLEKSIKARITAHSELIDMVKKASIIKKKAR